MREGSPERILILARDAPDQRRGIAEGGLGPAPRLVWTDFVAAAVTLAGLVQSGGEMAEGRLDRWLVRYRDTGDPEALGRLFDATAGELLRVARHLAPDAAEAEDLVQATFLALLEHPERYDGKRPARAWMVGILTLEAKHARRRAARRVDERWLNAEAQERAASLEPAAGVARIEVAALVSAALARVPELYRGVLERHLAGEPPAAIAGALERAPGTVRVQLHRGLELLRRALPAGVASGIGLAAPRAADVRGLAALRGELLALAEAASPNAGLLTTSSTAATTLGTILMAKKMLIVGAALAAMASLWLWNRAPDPAPALERGDGVVRRIEVNAVEADHDPAPLVDDSDQNRRAMPVVESAGARALIVDRLRIVVRYADGRDAAGVTFQIVSHAPRAPMNEATTDERGEALLTGLEPGQYTLYADRGGFDTMQVPRITWNDAPVDPVERAAELERLTPRHVFTLPAGHDLAGRVIDGLGRPVAGAEIWISTGLTRRSGHVVTRSAGDGTFLLRQLGTMCFVGARSGEYAPSSPVHVEHLVQSERLERGEAPAPIEVALRLPGIGARVQGTLRDPVGRPVGGARVRLGAQDFFDTLGPTGAEGPPPPIEVRTDEQGHFAGAGLAPGRVEVACLAEGFAVVTGALQVGAGEVGRLELALEHPVWVRGHVSDAAGEPLARITVRAHRPRIHGREAGSSFDEPEALSDGEGRFRLGPLPSGRLELSARSFDSTHQARNSLDAVAGGSYEWNFTLGESPRIAGQAFDAVGGTLAGWTVVAEPLGPLGPPPRAVFTDAHGRFELRFPAGGPVRLELFAPDEDPHAVSRFVPRAPKAWLEPVEVGARDVRLVIDPAHQPTARILGTLRVAVHPAPERVVLRVRHHDFGVILEEERSLRTGAFELTELPAGVLVLAIEAPGCAPLERVGIQLSQGESLDLGALELVAAAELVLHFDDAAGSAIEPHVALHDAQDRLRWGKLHGRTWRSVPLAPGAYRLLVQHEGRADLALQFELRSGETLERELTLVPGVSLGLVCLDASDAPIPGPIRIRVHDAAGQVVLAETLRGEGERPASRYFNAPLGVLAIEAADEQGRTTRETIELTGAETGGRMHTLRLR